jgi:hypothetical protein
LFIKKLQALLTSDRFCFAEILPRMKQLSMRFAGTASKNLQENQQLRPTYGETLGARSSRSRSVNVAEIRRVYDRAYDKDLRGIR